MKYNISINQKAILDSQLDIDLVDAAIFDYIKDFANSDKIKKFIEDGRTYFWIEYTHLMSELPLLKITAKDTIYRRISKLVKAKVLEAHPNNQQKAMSFYCFGEVYLKLITYGPNVVTPTDQTSDPYGFKSDPTDEKSDPYGSNVGPPTDEKSEYYNTIDNTTNNKPLAADAAPGISKVKKAPRIKKPKDPEQEGANKCFSEMKDYYFTWYKKECGEDPILDGGDFSAIKKIRDHYFKSMGSYEKSQTAFEYILKNWEALKDYKFYYTSRSPKQIHSNLLNILPLLREHHKKVSTKKMVI